tara:strand:- start:126 stop:476 length:351 start_codon:yes stop_codon:yes gene_type:complete
MIDRARKGFVHPRKERLRATMMMFAFSFFASSIDGRWIRQNATRYTSRAMRSFSVSQRNDTQNPKSECHARRFDEGKEERERETAFSNAKAGTQRNERGARTWTLVALRPATDAIC